MKVCKKCGSKYTKGTIYCPNCGTPVKLIPSINKTVGIFNSDNNFDIPIEFNDFEINSKLKTDVVIEKEKIIDNTSKFKILDNSNTEISFASNSTQFTEKKAISVSPTVAEFVGNNNNSINPTVAEFVGNNNNSANPTVAEFVGNNNNSTNTTVSQFISEKESLEINDINIQGLNITQFNNTKSDTENVLDPSFSAEFAVETKVPYAILVVIKGLQKGSVYKAFEGINTIGRSENMSISLCLDSSISRDTHCSLYCNINGDILLKSGKSKGITYVNNKPIFGECLLNNRDLIIIGSSTMMLIKLCINDFSWGS